MSLNKAIQCIQKQNDSIFASLVSKNIQFERTIIPEGSSEEEQQILLSEENFRLKEVVKDNKPIQQPKEEKKKQEPILVSKQENKPKEKKDNEKKDNEKKDNDNDDDDENYEEPIKKFDTLTNMEEMKRAFFNGDYVSFEEQIKANPFKLFKVGYKYNSDKDNVPEFSAKNLLKGFVRNFDDYRKYFMICFRCWKHLDKTQYKYDSVWVVNTNEPIQNIIGSLWDDFSFEETTDFDSFIELIKKIPDTEEPVFTNEYTCIGESYVH